MQVLFLLHILAKKNRSVNTEFRRYSFYVVVLKRNIEPKKAPDTSARNQSCKK